jgi:hypothetical protein
MSIPYKLDSFIKMLSVVNSGHQTFPADDPYVFLTSALSGNVSVDEYAGFLHIAIIDVFSSIIVICRGTRC